MAVSSARLHKHDANRTSGERFVRFFVHQIETGLRTSPQYPNAQFNILVDLHQVVLCPSRLLQPMHLPQAMMVTLVSRRVTQTPTRR